MYIVHINKSIINKKYISNTQFKIKKDFLKIKKNKSHLLIYRKWSF